MACSYCGHKSRAPWSCEECGQAALWLLREPFLPIAIILMGLAGIVVQL